MLLGIVNGHLDWPVGAVAVVMALIVRECPEAEVEVAEVLRRTAEFGLRVKGSMGFVEAVLLSLLRMPSLDEVDGRWVNDRLASMWWS